MADKDFLGSGMKFPPQINKATGRFITSSENQSVKESVYLILMTAMGERFMRPDFGSNLMSYTFMDVNSTTVAIMQRNLTRFIMTQEPRVSEVTVYVDNVTRPGALLVDINYTVSATNTRDNLVFPFYLNNESPEAEKEAEYDSGNPDDAYEPSEDDEGIDDTVEQDME